MFKKKKASYIDDKGIVEKSETFDVLVTIGCIVLSAFFIVLSIITITYS